MPKEDEPRTTLLVAPVSVIAAWQYQIEKFIEPWALSVETYLGHDRPKILNRIKRKNDVTLCLTSYETLASDWKKFQEYQLERDEAKEQAKKKAKKSNKSVRETCKLWGMMREGWS